MPSIRVHHQWTRNFARWFAEKLLALRPNARVDVANCNRRLHYAESDGNLYGPSTARDFHGRLPEVRVALREWSGGAPVSVRTLAEMFESPLAGHGGVEPRTSVFYGLLRNRQSEWPIRPPR